MNAFRRPFLAFHSTAHVTGDTMLASVAWCSYGAIFARFISAAATASRTIAVSGRNSGEPTGPVQFRFLALQGGKPGKVAPTSVRFCSKELYRPVERLESTNAGGHDAGYQIGHDVPSWEYRCASWRFSTCYARGQNCLNLNWKIVRGYLDFVFTADVARRDR